MPEHPADRYEHMTTAVVFDIFVEASNDLIGLLAHHSDTATCPAEREEWWQRVLAVRDARRSVAPYDRRALLEHIAAWRAGSCPGAPAPWPDLRPGRSSRQGRTRDRGVLTDRSLTTPPGSPSTRPR